MADVVLGVVGGAMVILALLSAFTGREGAAASSSGPPAVTLLSPADRGVVPSRLELVFRPAVEIAPYPAGWGTAEFHLHLDLDGREFMPAPHQIERLPSGEYRWTFGQLQPGLYSLRLFWSDAGHRPVEGGGSERVTVEVR